MSGAKTHRGGFLRGMLDGWRSSVGSSQGSQGGAGGSSCGGGGSGSQSLPDVDEKLRPNQFDVIEIAKHGFPYKPTAIAYDPVQRLLAIGNKQGALRLLGRPGVELHAQHLPWSAVIQLIFLRNEGQLLSVCADDTIHLWDFKTKKKPGIVQSLKFQRERITFCHLAFQSKWLYIGTERGNVHVANIETFMLSGYVINWNKAIELSRKTHPGAIIHLSDCPCDANKLLIGYDSGILVLWDLRSRTADTRASYGESLKSVSWHHEGRQFLCSHADGSLSTWNVKATRPVSVVFPHASKSTSTSKSESGNSTPDHQVARESCKPMTKVEWKTVRSGDSFIIFSGGLPYDKKGAAASSGTSTPREGQAHRSGAASSASLTIVQGKTTTVLEMEATIVDFVPLCENPYDSDFNDPYAVAVLLTNDLVVVDLTSPGYPCFPNPYTMDLHESPITCCYYLADCASDLIPAFYSVGLKTNTKRPGFSDKDWPVNGGEWGSASLPYAELLITGHADGTLKFWDASSVNLHILYKMKTSKLFDKPKARPPGPGEDANGAQLAAELDDPFAIDHIALCSESRLLCIAGACAQVLVFKFNKQETTSELPVVEVVTRYDTPAASEEEEAAQGIGGLLKAQQGSSGDELAANSPNSSMYFPLTVKSGPHKRGPGFQPELACLSPSWADDQSRAQPFKVTALALHAQHNLVAYGNENGLVIIDLIQRCAILNVGTADLYGSADPLNRYISKSSKAAAPGDVDALTGKARGASAEATPNADPSENPKSTKSFSRSSSLASVEPLNLEAVQFLTFAETFTTKAESSLSPCLWVGTALGAVICVSLTLPETNDDRVLCLQSVLAVASGNVFKVKGAVLRIALLDATGALMTLAESSRTGTSRVIDREPHYCVLVSEKTARVLSLPSQQCAFKANLSESSFVVRADIVQIKTSDGVCLITYLATGNIVAYSLPSLKLLVDIDFVPLIDVRIARTLTFSTNGIGLYLCSPSEVSKFAICSDSRETFEEMVGNIFQVKEMPEPPKQSFFKGLFGGAPSILDREELFSEQVSGKGSKTMARQVPGNFDASRLQAGSLASELAKVRQGLQERGENLEKLEDRTAVMANQAEGFRDISHQLLNKYKDKKWYQF